MFRYLACLSMDDYDGLTLVYLRCIGTLCYILVILVLKEV